MISPSLTDTNFGWTRAARPSKSRSFIKEIISSSLYTRRCTSAQTGLYDFDADSQPRPRVPRRGGRSGNETGCQAQGDRQIALGDSGSPKAEKFNKEQAQDDLYRWSSLRSSYTAEANVDRAQNYTMGGWYGAGWDWDPYYSCYTYIPGDGIFYSPFGWGFYSPFFVGLLRLASLATSTMILMTFVTLKVESAVTGVTLVIGGGLWWWGGS